MQPSTLAKRGALLLFLVVVAFYFYGLGQIPLVGPDEPRYAQVAREMLLRRDLITPTLGGHTWFEKPALLYWMMIGSFKLFGVSEWAARLPAAVSGLLTIAAVFVVAGRVEQGSDNLPADAGGSDKGHKLEGYAFWCTLAAASMVGIVAFSRAASFDIILTMTLTWTLAFYVLHEFEPDGKRRLTFLAGFYAFIGLSLLAKGLIGIVIPAGVVGLYYLFQRGLPRRDTLVSIVWGAPLALAVAATWYAPVIARHGWPFINEFFIQHHFARYVSDKYHHYRPAYYYLLVVPLLALPWAAFFVDGLLQCKSWLRRAGVSPGLASEERLRTLMVFALAWFLFPFVFFSFSNSKLPGYILPVLPAAALMVGERLWTFYADTGRRRWPVISTAAFFLLFAVFVLGYWWWRPEHLRTALAWLVATPLLVAGGFALLRRRTPVAPIVLAGATIVVLIVAIDLAAPGVADRESSKRLLQLAAARGYSQTAIYGMQRSDRTPEFYAAERVVYGPDGEPVMYEGPGQVVYEARRRGDTILAFAPLDDLKQLNTLAPTQIDLIDYNGSYAIIAVRAR